MCAIIRQTPILQIKNEEEKNLIIYSVKYGISITKCGCETGTFIQLHKVRLPFSCVLDRFNPCHSSTTQIFYCTSNDILVDQVDLHCNFPKLYKFFAYLIIQFICLIYFNVKK